MADTGYPTLFSPLRVGPVELRNRVVLSAMTTGFGFDAGAPTDDLLAYFAARAHDVGMAVVAFGAVSPEGRVEQKVPWMWRDDAARILAPLAASIAAAGAVPCLQLAHGGRQVSPLVIGGDPVAPSAIPPSVHVASPPRELGPDEIDELVAAFGRAAAVAAAAGFEAVEIHAAHGYLIHQFLAETSNSRTDAYGANRALFGARVVESVCAAAPGLAVIVRINGDDLMPDGTTPEMAAATAARFVAAGAHGITVSAGVYGSVPYTIPLLDDPEGLFLEAAHIVRDAVDVPVIGVGRITDPATAERALTAGDCDAVAIGRALLADPDWVHKARRGNPAAIRPCIATVQGCAGMLQHGDPISCTVNPEVGREGRTVARPDRPSRVAVVGAGPAGMEAALTAAGLGHDVRLLERSKHLGGAVRQAAATPPLGHLHRLIAWYAAQMDEAGVDVRTGVDADLVDLEAAGWAEIVIAATGAVTAPPVVDGYDELDSWTLEDILAGRPSSTGNTAMPQAPIVIGAGQRALALALWFAAKGSRPTLLSGSRPGGDTSGLARRALLARLEAAGVPTVSGALRALTPEGATFTANDETSLIGGDGAVITAPVRSVQLRSAGRSAVPLLTVGDARAPRGIGPAIAEGRDAAERVHDLVG